jgi:D-alanyl-D-alanine dipeptidase
MRAPGALTRWIAVGWFALFLAACGGGGGSSPDAVPSLALFAGDASNLGSIDGTGSAARFNGASGVATDSAGNVFVADTGNHTIRKITPAGVVTTLAGTAGSSGSTDASGAAARFNNPRGVATDSAGNVYVADTGNDTIRKITPTGVVSTLAGTAGSSGSTDASGAAARFNSPRGIASDAAGTLYVADSGNDTIRKITPTGAVTTLAGTAGAAGSTDASGAAARFNDPMGVAIDSANNVYVADSGNNTIRKITPAGVVTTLAGTAGIASSADGLGAAASFNGPTGVATDSAANVYVADTNNNTIRKVTAAGSVSTIAGKPQTAGFTPGSLPGLLSAPSGVAISGTSLYIMMSTLVAVVQNRP